MILIYNLLQNIPDYPQRACLADSPQMEKESEETLQEAVRIGYVTVTGDPINNCRWAQLTYIGGVAKKQLTESDHDTN